MPILPFDSESAQAGCRCYGKPYREYMLGRTHLVSIWAAGAPYTHTIGTFRLMASASPIQNLCQKVIKPSALETTRYHLLTLRLSTNSGCIVVA